MKIRFLGVALVLVVACQALAPEGVMAQAVELEPAIQSGSDEAFETKQRRLNIACASSEPRRPHN